MFGEGKVKLRGDLKWRGIKDIVMFVSTNLSLVDWFLVDGPP